MLIIPDTDKITIKEKYESPILEIIRVEAEDVITASPGIDDGDED